MSFDYQKPAALISVSNKSNIGPFAKKLNDAGFQIISTGNTASAIAEFGVPVTTVADITKFPEIMDGRVKTLHPLIHGGLLGDRNNESHVQAIQEHQIPNIQVVCVNLYPFQETVSKPDTTLEQAIENIDIGGPAMLRAAAKNFHNIAVVCDICDYEHVANMILKNGGTTLAERKKLAIKAFKHTRDYDTAICDYFDNICDEELPHFLALDLKKVRDLRYGENPHQRAALYQDRCTTCATTRPLGDGFEQLNGKELSYNNLVDLDAAIQLVAEFHEPCAAIIKHTNPAGCATSDKIVSAFEDAHACDPISAFGGIVALNRKVDVALAIRLSESFYEIITAPDYTPEALQILNKKKNLRVIKQPSELVFPKMNFKATTLGYIAQTLDPAVTLNAGELHIPTEKKPTREEMQSLVFAWKVCKHVKSNAVVLAQNLKTIGIGAGQMSRIDSVEIAANKATIDIDGAVLASDAFFPFRDGPDACARMGITAIIQPGGSRRDQEVIDACNEHGIAMVFTGKRHFRH